MNQLVPHRPSPSGLRALFSVRRTRPDPSSHPEQFRIRNFFDPKRLTHADIRARCKFCIEELFKPIAPHERSNKALFRKVSKATGLGMQRIERLWRQYITKPDGLELAVLETARTQRQAGAGQGAGHVEQILGGAVDYSASRWRETAEARPRDRARREASSTTEDADR
jgi:hypothetical protein